MAKVTLNTLTTLTNTKAVNQLNQNFATIAAQLDLLLSRDGESPNTMDSTLDMNNQRVINLPVPVNATEAARHGDLQTYVDDAQAAATTATTQATTATNAATTATTVQTEFNASWRGTASTDPTTDSDGNALQVDDEGLLYANTTENVLKYWVSQEVLVGSDGVLVGSDNVVLMRWASVDLNRVLDAEDVNAPGITNGQILEWNTGQGRFLPRTLPNYDFSLFVQGLLFSSELIYSVIANRAFRVPTNLAGASIEAGTAADAESIVTVRKNGVSIGTLTWAAAGTEPTVVVTQTDFAVGDTLEFVAPPSADATLADISISFQTERL